MLLLTSVARGQNLEPCDRSDLHYRNLEKDAITKVAASYPNERGVRAKGTVAVLIKVDRRGNVVSARVVCGHPLLAASSVATARRWKFQPRRVNGKRVNSIGIITFDFAPNDGAAERGAIN